MDRFVLYRNACYAIIHGTRYLLKNRKAMAMQIGKRFQRCYDYVPLLACLLLPLNAAVIARKSSRSRALPMEHSSKTILPISRLILETVSFRHALLTTLLKGPSAVPIPRKEWMVIGLWFAGKRSSNTSHAIPVEHTTCYFFTSMKVPAYVHDDSGFSRSSLAEND